MAETPPVCINCNNVIDKTRHGWSKVITATSEYHLCSSWCAERHAEWQNRPRNHE